jgi:hypothetical protein
MANVGPPVISRLNHRFSKTLHTQRGPITIKIYLPVAAREIRVAAHDRGIYRGRVAIAAITLFATSWILYSLFEFAGQASSAVGQQIFALQAWGGFIFACGAFTATIDCISREKRDGTLGLLFLTHLKGRDVILGKLVSALALFFSGAIATLPILTLPILLGGIRLSQSFYLLVSLLTTMLFSAAAGMLASALSIKRQHAGGIAAFVVMTFCVAIPLTILSLRKLSQFEAAYLLQFFTPLYMQQLASGAVTGLQFGYFWTCFGIVFATSCVLLAAASFITPRTWQQRAKDPLLKRLTERHAAWTVRTIKSRSPLGRRLLDRNAYEWLAARELSAPTKAWTFIVAIVLLAAAAILNFIRHNDTSAVLITVCVPAAYIMQMNIKVRIGGHASDRFTSDRECNALELLLCTPLSIREMVAAEFRALRRHFILPALTIIALLLLGLKLSQGGVDKLSQLFTTDGDPSFHRYAVAVIASAILFLIIDTIALAWAGAWCGLACRKIQQARSSAMALVTVIPFVLFIALTPAVLQSSTARAFFQSVGFFPPFVIALVFLTASDLIVIHFARRWLLQHARERLTNPVVHERASNSFLAFFRTDLDSKAPLKIGNGAKAR